MSLCLSNRSLKKNELLKFYPLKLKLQSNPPLLHLTHLNWQDYSSHALSCSIPPYTPISHGNDLMCLRAWSFSETHLAFAVPAVPAVRRRGMRAANGRCVVPQPRLRSGAAARARPEKGHLRGRQWPGLWGEYCLYPLGADFYHIFLRLQMS